jgi:hypothetical protein
MQKILAGTRVHRLWRRVFSRQVDETAYLLSSPANAEHLRRSLGSIRRGEIRSVTMDELRKELRVAREEAREQGKAGV